MAYRHDYDKILIRLTTILSRLNEGEALSVKALAEEFNTSERTIQRDFNERLSRFPIYQEQKKWKMQKGYRIEKVKSLEEEIVLGVIEKLAESVGGTFAVKAQKLLSRLKNRDFSPIYAKLNIEEIGDRVHDIETIERAICEKRKITCRYTSVGKESRHISIAPLKIVNFEGFWYLLALHAEQVKKYYLRNLSHLHLSDTAFENRKEVDTLLENAISVWFREDVQPVEVLLFADARAAHYFQRRPLPTQQIDSIKQDGSIYFRIQITHEMEILPIVKYWIPHLHIKKPIWLKNLLHEELTDYLDTEECLPADL